MEREYVIITTKVRFLQLLLIDLVSDKTSTNIYLDTFLVKGVLCLPRQRALSPTQTLQSKRQPTFTNIACFFHSQFPSIQILHSRMQTILPPTVQCSNIGLRILGAEATEIDISWTCGGLGGRFYRFYQGIPSPDD